MKKYPIGVTPTPTGRVILSPMGQLERPHYLKAWRESADLTLQEVADRLGVTRGSIQKAEAFETDTPLSTLVRIAGALHIEPGELFYPPPTTVRAQLALDILKLNDADTEVVAGLVTSLLTKEEKSKRSA